MHLFKSFTDFIQSIFGNQLVVKIALVFSPFFFRAQLYQSWVSYRVERARGFQLKLDPRMEKAISEHPEVYDRWLTTPDKIANAALKITADFLTFDSEDATKTDPLSIGQAEAVNGTNLAAFYTMTAQYLIQKNGVANRYTCQQYVAQRRHDGTSLHDLYISPYGTSPFNLERDIVAIIDLKTGEKRFVDPTLYEQASITKITVEGERAASTRSAAQVSR